jgi:F0F1-type ATP synthase assembly protein I
MPESPNPDLQNKDSKPSSMATLARYSEIGFIIPAGVIIGLIAGKLVDHWLGTKWVYIAGLIFGAIVGFIQLIRMVTRAEKEF